MHEYSPQRPAQVRRQSARQYESIYDANADARRGLYPYEKPPWENRPPYNIWENMADFFNPESAERIVDLGTNDSYFYRILKHKGFNGEFIGIDIEGKDLPAVEKIVTLGYPEAKVEFKQADAQRLKGVIDSDSTPNVLAAFFLYHAERPQRVISEIHRILTPGGRAIVATRDITNQMDTWVFAREAAHQAGFGFPQEIIYDRGSKERELNPAFPIERIIAYSHFDIEALSRSLDRDPRFSVKYRLLQDGDLWIPMTETGIYDIENAIESLLPYTENIATGAKPGPPDIDFMRQRIQTDIRHKILTSASENEQADPRLDGPYYKSHVSQAFYVVEAIK